MDKKIQDSQALAAAITKAGSKQSYYTFRFFVDRKRVADAYRAYAYFRWLDDVLDEEDGSQAEKIAFAERQARLLETAYRGEVPVGLCKEEWMLVDLIHGDLEPNSGLQAYLRNMMKVMVFDAGRRGRTITQTELTEYSRSLAVSVTEFMHHFIGHEDSPAFCDTRYHAVTAAHITHMLRDTVEDIEAGYFNVPAEHLQARGIGLQEFNGQAYEDWVRERVQLARQYFEAGRECMTKIKNLRCRLVGFAYIARFEWVLGAIERDGYRLRSAYPERKSLRAGIEMSWSTLVSILASFWPKVAVPVMAGKADYVEEL